MALPRAVQLLALFGFACCILWPVLSAPVSPTPLSVASASTRPAALEHRGGSGDVIGGGSSSSSGGGAVAARDAGFRLDSMQTHGYHCKQGSCNVCRFRPQEIVGSPPPGLGDCTQSRVEGTNVSRQELAAYGIRYLQVGGDWWNKCGDGWLNADFIFMRLPVGFVCEDWRTGRHILRGDAGHRWPFEDASFDLVYSEHMFEHILPMDGAAFLREAYRILRPGGVLRVTTPDLEKCIARRALGRRPRRGLISCALGE